MQDYNSEYTDLHAYFDIGYNDQGQMIQVDANNTYQFSKISEKSISTYQFVSIPHSTGVPQQIYGNIQLVDYEVYGLCTRNSSLDYIVGLHIESNEIRVMRLQNDSTNTQTIYDYKKVDKDDLNTILEGTIYVDCQYQGQFLGMSYYSIGIAGTYFHSNQISSYYLAKFSTKYNFTEYFVISDNPYIMEAAKGVNVDLDGALPGIDNANVAIHGYSWQRGVRTWTTLLGNVNFTDSFGRMRNYGSFLYVFLNSFSGTYSTNTSQTDIYYYRLRTTNGNIEGSQVFGSPQDDKILDLDLTFTGIYVLASINDYFLPHRDNDKYWSTKYQMQNLVVIWMSYTDFIIDIEGFALNETVSPYPMAIFVPRTADIQQNFVFVSPRSNNLIDSNGGFLITYLSDSTQFFAQIAGCGNNCFVCSPNDNSICIQCNSGYQIFENACYSGCPTFSYQKTDDSGNYLDYCKRCHYSCMTCSGPNNDQCSSCCTNNTCGPINNRQPNLGQCQCPAGLFDSNGLCVQKCTINLAGKSNQLCYPQCPGNSFPSIQYDQATAQERSQYDAASSTYCSQSVNHLKFLATGKGLPVQGQPDISLVPQNFTISFWVRPSTLNTISYFFNAYNRISVRAQGSSQKVFFAYRTGTSQTVEPTTYTNDANQRVTLDSWNYIAVSQREILSVNIQKYEQLLAIANLNMGTVNQAGYGNTIGVVRFPQYSNTIYIGGYSDQNPQSFTGYMKEFKFFTKFHGLAQFKDESIRMYRYYSYDDPNLVAYWKFNETYTATDSYYVINDYSQNQNQISYSKTTNPLYPQYVLDQSASLSLCIFHDVAICQTPDYRSSHPFVVLGSRLTQSPTFTLADSYSLIKANGDQVWFMANNTNCSFTQKLAYMTYQTNFLNNWIVPDPNFNPVNLIEGNHYQICYYIQAKNVAFNMFQQYIINRPKTIDPSNNDAYMSDGVLRSFYSSGGDQSYGDVIKFSVNCSTPASSDYEMRRSAKPSYGTQAINTFALGGDFNLCWQHTFVQEQLLSYYESIHGLQFRIVGVPTLPMHSDTQVSMNEDLVQYKLVGGFAEGDQLAYSWSGYVPTDCNPTNFVGGKYTRVNYNWPSVWFGYSSGINGIGNYSMDTLHMCYKSAATDAPDAWSRIKKISGGAFAIQVMNYLKTTTNGKCPEFISFTPTYGSTQLYETDNTIQFQFKSQAVYPSLQANGQTGQIAIFRGAMTPDGKIVKTTNTLWYNFNLNDTISPNPFQQGDLICSGSGQCSIILSQQANKMKGGEIYFLSFYLQSFAYKTSASSTTRYYLFNNKVLDTANGQTTAYDHLFFCRSFNVTSSSQMINGRSFTMAGIDLVTKSMMVKLSGFSINTATFTTKAINLYLTVINTQNTYCITTPPVATVEMKDVTATSFTVNNLELRQCNEGTLVANIELIRGDMDQYGQYTYVRSEWQKNVTLGVIGCDPSCMFCNGTTSSSCIVCADTTQKIFMGTCNSKCPSTQPFYLYETVIIQRQIWDTYTCVSECPLGYYPDQNSNQCMECNTDCQTCASNYIASCITCEPIKYLFNGICLIDCPSPHYSNNFTSYKCDQISQTTYLQVKIQSLGYTQKIPKDQQQYLKAAISNEGGGDILTILWEQIEPEPTSDQVTIFTSTSQGDLLNRQAVIELKMTAFNYMASMQVVKVQVTVVNSLGETAIDVYEFYQNQPPTAGNSTIMIMNNVNNGGVIASKSIYQMVLSSWQDTIAQGEENLKFKLYMTINSVYYTLTDQTFATNFYFMIPLITNDPTDSSNHTIQICTLCTDYYQAVTTQCQKLYNITNNAIYLSNYTALVAHLQILNYTANMTNIVYASNVLFMAMNSSRRVSSAPGLCTLDYHCNYNGACTTQYGSQRCVCDFGYSGTFCQFAESQFQDLQTIGNSLITNLYQNMSSKSQLKPNDIEIIGTVLRGALKDPDLVNDNYLEDVIQTLEMVGNSPIYAFQPLSQNVRQIYFDALDAVIQKLFHSSKVGTAYPDGQILAEGLTLFDQYAASQQQRMLNSNAKGFSELLRKNKNLRVNDVDESSLQFLKKEDSQGKQELLRNQRHQSYLIGGIQSKKKEMRKLGTDSNLYQSYARRIDVQLTTFIERFIYVLNPDNTKFTYSTNSFDLSIYAQYASNYLDQLMYIKERDVYWYFPSTLFDNVQGYASSMHFVGLKALKYKANPVIFERNPGGFTESNVTDLTFYDAAMNHINVTLSSSYVMIKEPYNNTQSYNQELMRCMAWDSSVNSFINDGSCSVGIIYDDVPCYSCDADTFLNISVTLCRCTHLSRFAVVYEETVPSDGMGVQVGIYSDFFAMQYWMNSFGLYAVIAGAVVYTVGLLISIKIDQHTQPKVMERLKERIRKLELKGFQQKPKQKKLIVKRDFDGNIIFIRNNGPEEELKKKEEEQKKSKKKVEDLVESTPVTQLQKPTLSKKVAKTPLNNKKFNKDDDMLQEAEYLPVKGKGGKKLSKLNQTASKSPLNRSLKEFEEDQMSTVKGPEEMLPTQLKGDVNRIDHDLFEQQMLKRFEEEKEIDQFIKAHGTSSSEEDMAEKLRSKEQKHYLKIEKKAKEMYWYHWKSLIIHGNHVSSLLYITSFLSPRHARWTLLFTCIFLNWFWCAVIYNNTKDPLQLPDFDKKASSLATDDLWISIVSPIGTIVLMYIFAGIFKVSDERLAQSYTMIYLEQMLVELRKEMKLRFIIAYMITFAIYAAITWYVIKFSSTFGWKVSWTWFYSGLFAIMLQLLIYDNLISMIHWVTYYCSRTLAIFWMKVRMLKQAKSEGQ